MSDPIDLNKNNSGTKPAGTHRKPPVIHKEKIVKKGTGQLLELRGTLDRGIEAGINFKAPPDYRDYFPTRVVDPKTIAPDLTSSGDAMVRSIVVGALTRANGNVLHAWQDVQGSRKEEKGRYDDDYLASAEHYLNSLYISREQTLGTLENLITVPFYSAVKNLLYPIGVLDLFKTGDGPVTPPSERQDNWGIAGIVDSDNTIFSIENTRGTANRLGESKPGTPKK